MDCPFGRNDYLPSEAVDQAVGKLEVNNFVRNPELEVK
jgi:hypothetical protein